MSGRLLMESLTTLLPDLCFCFSPGIADRVSACGTVYLALMPNNSEALQY